MVVHLEYNNKVLCGTNASNILKSVNREDVTCKRCLAKLVRLDKFNKHENIVPLKLSNDKPMVSNPIKKQEYTETRDVVFVMDRRYGPCILFDDNTIVKLGDKISDRLGIVAIINKKGKILSGPLLKGAEGITLSSGVETFRNWFRKQKETRDIVMISEVKSSFT